MKPSIGRIVHYVEGGIHYAGIITAVWSDECVNIHVFSTDGFPNGPIASQGEVKTSRNYAEDFREYSWHWPEKI